MRAFLLDVRHASGWNRIRRRHVESRYPEGDPLIRMLVEVRISGIRDGRVHPSEEPPRHRHGP